MSIIVKADFVGRWQIPLNGINDAVLTSVIDSTEEKYLIALLGDDLYYSFITGLGATPPLTKWTFLRDGGYYKQETGLDDDITNVRFRGLKEMVKCFVWCEYMILTRYQIDTIGMNKPDTENGAIVDNQDFSGEIQSMFNAGLDIYNKAVRYLCEMNFNTDVININGVNVTLENIKQFQGGEVITVGSETRTVVSVAGSVLTLNQTITSSFIEYIFYRNFIHQPKTIMSNY
jgi:hypothetical protein